MFRTLLGIAIVIGATGDISVAQRQVLPLTLTPISLASTNDDTQVPYYVFVLPVPNVPAGSELAEAFLEFFLDVSSTAPAGATDGVVTFELFTFPGAVNGKLDSAALEPSSMKEPVRAGNDRSVRVHVTELAQRIIADPTSNRNLIMGSVVSRTGRFDAKTVPGAAPGTKANLIVHFRRIESGMIDAQ